MKRKNEEEQSMYQTYISISEMTLWTEDVDFRAKIDELGYPKRTLAVVEKAVSRTGYTLFSSPYHSVSVSFSLTDPSLAVYFGGPSHAHQTKLVGIFERYTPPGFGEMGVSYLRYSLDSGPYISCSEQDWLQKLEKMIDTYL
jgi:hypothetical protein